MLANSTLQSALTAPAAKPECPQERRCQRTNCLHLCELAAARPPPPAKRNPPSGSIVICGQLIKTGITKLFNFHDAPAFDASYPGCFKGPDRAPRLDPHAFCPAKGLQGKLLRFRPRRGMLGRDEDIGQLRKLVRQFVVHHDGCDSSETCFHVLHDERSLSAHFLIDADGTIYQTLDLAFAAFHAEAMNECSLGVELCNRGALPSRADPRFERERQLATRQGRQSCEATIHGHHREMWTFTDPQYTALGELASVLLDLLPNLPKTYPQQAGTKDVIPTTITDARRFSGFLGHYHASLKKWDPGSFCFPRLMSLIKGQPRWFFLAAPIRDSPPPPIAEAPRVAAAQAQAYFDANEQLAPGGYFPIGPWGRELVWHGGIHLQRPAASKVYSPFPARIVATRFGAEDGPTGARNFVLLQHDFVLRSEALTFYILYYHLAPERGGAGARTPWFWERTGGKVPARVTARGVWFPDCPIAAGEVIGHVGLAGPPDGVQPQLHVEVLARKELTAHLDAKAFTAVDCGSGGLVCTTAAVRSILGGLSPRDFFRSRGDGAAQGQLRRLAVRFPSEWGSRDRPAVERQLSATAAYQGLSQEQRAELFCTQLEPNQWWDDEVSRRTGLPEDYVVWHYHPVTFLVWLQTQLQSRSGQATAHESSSGAQATDGLEGDSGFVGDEDTALWDVESRADGAAYTWEELAEGYPEHWVPTPR